MGIESVVLELMGRIQILEEKVARLESAAGAQRLIENEPGNVASKVSLLDNHPEEKNKKEASLTQRARDLIAQKKAEAFQRGEKSIKLLCNDLQKALGISNRTPCVCKAMYDSMTNPKDKVLCAPPSGFSTTVLVEYCLEEC